jgi:hypothetical protein
LCFLEHDSGRKTVITWYYEDLFATENTSLWLDKIPQHSL